MLQGGRCLVRAVPHLRAHGHARPYIRPAVMHALYAYDERFGHVRVPAKFVVPHDGAWPAHTHGLALGSSVSKLRTKYKRDQMPLQDVEALEAVGFVWDVPEWRWECVLGALRVYKEVHGDLQVPRAFVVPSQAPWPEAAWGIKLGFAANNIRHSGLYVRDHSDRRAELDALGFLYDASKWQV